MTQQVLIGSDGTVEPAPQQAPATRVVTAITLTSEHGAVSLLGGPLWLMGRAEGLTGPDAELDVRVIPGMDGGFIIGEDTDQAGLSLAPLDVTLTLLVDGGSAEASSQIVANLRTLLNARRFGRATLSVTRADGQTRTLPVVHVPKRGDFDPPGLHGPLRIVTLRMVATSPLWRGQPGSGGPWFLDTGAGGGELPADLPFDLAASLVVGEANPIVVLGDEVTYPVLVATGEFASMEVSSIRDGVTRGYELVNTLPAGQTLTVRHDPTSLLGGQRQVEGPGGISWAQYLVPGADLFELRPGPQAISVVLTGGLAGASARMTWETLHWSAVD